MADYRIYEVSSKKDIRKFIKFPDELYKDCPQYVPALHSDQMASLTTVSTLSYCTRKMWVVKDGDKIVGRICGMVNPRYNELYNKKRARFGWFDTINDLEVAKLLLNTAEAWAKEMGMDEIHGPLYYNTLGKQGMLTEGFDNLPQFNCIYNYPYYNDLVSALGYEKECDWVQYKMDIGQGILPKAKRVSELLLNRYNLHFADIGKLKHNKELVREFFHIYNESFMGRVYNFVPFTDEEIDEEASAIIKFINPDVSSIVLDENDKPAGFAICIPSISKGMQKAKGKLFPFGWFHILRSLKEKDTLDMMVNGAAPAWQNKGISGVYMVDVYNRCSPLGYKWAISNPQIETNSAVNMWAQYDTELVMRRRCYIKSI